jgi:hypothetical protein
VERSLYLFSNFSSPEEKEEPSRGLQAVALMHTTTHHNVLFLVKNPNTVILPIFVWVFYAKQQHSLAKSLSPVPLILQVCK